MDKIPLLKVRHSKRTGNVQGENNYSYHLPSNFNFMNVQNDNSFRVFSDAIQNNNTSKVQEILKQRHPPITDSSGTTILHIGIQWGNEDMLMLLLMHPAVQRLKNKADERGMTPLICAARYNNVFAIKTLCKLNVDVTRTMYKKGGNALHYAARLEDPKVAELLLQHNSLPEFINASNEDGNTPLAIAAEAKSPVARHLLNAGVDVTSQNKINGRTVLHVTIAYNNMDFFKTLLDCAEYKKQLIAQVNFEKDSPLMFAVKLGKLEFVKLLAEHNMDYNGINQHLCETVLHRAILMDRIDILREVLRHCNLDFLEYPDAKGRPPLILAGERDNVECFTELLDNDANLMVLNKRTDENILHAVLRAKSDKIVNVLMGKEMFISTFFYQKDCEGNTPMMSAIRANNEHGLMELLQAGWYYTYETNSAGETAMYYAAKNGSFNILRLLLLSEHYYTFYKKHRSTLDINDSEVICDAEIRGDIHASDVFILLGKKIKHELYSWRAKALLKRSEGNRNMFHACALGGSIECLQFIYSYYVNFNYNMDDFDAKCETGDTPLLLALQCGVSSLWCVKFFMSHGANLSMRNNRGLDVFKAFNLHMPHQEHLWSGVLDTCVALNLKRLDKYVDVNFSMLCPRNENQMKITRLLYDNLRNTSKRHFLTHPVLELFILLKFQKIKRLIFFRFVFYAIFTLCITVVLSVYLMPAVHKYLASFYSQCLGFFLLYSLFGLLLSLPHVLGEKQLYAYVLSAYPSFGIAYLLFGGRGLPFALENIGFTILVSWLLLLMYAAETFAFLSHQFAMYTHIVNNITKYFLVLLVILIAFSVSFFCLFGDDEKFSNPLISFIYTALIMLPGRLDEMPIFDEKNRDLSSNLSSFLLQCFICLLFLFIAVIAMLNMLVGLAIRGGHTLEVDGDIILNYIKAHWVNDYELLFQTGFYRLLEKCKLVVLIGVPLDLKHEIDIPLTARVKHKDRDLYPPTLMGNLTKLAFKRHAETEDLEHSKYLHWEHDRDKIKKCLRSMATDDFQDTLASLWSNFQTLEKMVTETKQK